MSDDLRAFLAKARGTAATARVLSLDELRAQRGADEVTEPWGLAAMRGRLVELSARGATATLTAAMELVLEAQMASEPVVWITGDHGAGGGSFYPPDVADTGIDLAALVVVRAIDVTTVVRVAERVLRSGAFGLVVLDVGAAQDGISMAHQGRLVSLAQAHDAAVVCLTEKNEATASLGSLVSLRVEAMRSISSPGSRAELEVTVRALKDKRRGPGWTRKVKVRGPAGL
jgi:recombination protein RecA